MSAAAKPASDPKRRAQLAAIHQRTKQLGMSEDDRRALYVRKTGLDSAADMTDAQLGAVLDELRRLGARSHRTLEGTGRPGEPQERLAIALWRDLGRMGVPADPSDAGLRKFAKHLVGIEVLAWGDAKQLNAVIEALKAWRAREQAKAVTTRG
jgi:phage gp16-like protein